jgi:hypothetical protein
MQLQKYDFDILNLLTLVMQQIELISARITFIPSIEFHKSQLAFYKNCSHDSSKISVPLLTNIMIWELALHFNPLSIANELSTDHDHYSIKIASPMRDTLQFSTFMSENAFQ